MTLKLLAFSLLLSTLCAAQAYTVQSGDTVYSIARKNGLSVEELLKLNGMDSPDLKIGQELQVTKGAVKASNAHTPKAATVAQAVQTATQTTPAAPSSATPSGNATSLSTTTDAAPIKATPSTGSFKVGTVTVRTPTHLKMGDAFSILLSGPGAAAATVRFPSELSEDVRRPNEVLTPYGAAESYVIPGRVVLGKGTPVVAEVKVGDVVERRSIAVAPVPKKSVQNLNLPPRLGSKLKDPGKAAEDALVNSNYERRSQPQWTRPFSAPLDKLRVTSSFGSARTYVAGGPTVYHYGADYPAKAGTPIHAVNDGTVVIAGNYPVRGGFVMIDHGGGVASLYFHQSKVIAKVGQVVKRGDTIGLVGETGLADGPHLHLEMRVRGEATNPVEWFGRLWP